MGFVADSCGLSIGCLCVSIRLLILASVTAGSLPHLFASQTILLKRVETAAHGAEQLLCSIRCRARKTRRARNFLAGCAGIRLPAVAAACSLQHQRLSLLFSDRLANGRMWKSPANSLLPQCPFKSALIPASHVPPSLCSMGFTVATNWGNAF